MKYLIISGLVWYFGYINNIICGTYCIASSSCHYAPFQVIGAILIGGWFIKVVELSYRKIYIRYLCFSASPTLTCLIILFLQKSYVLHLAHTQYRRNEQNVNGRDPGLRAPSTCATIAVGGKMR